MPQWSQLCGSEPHSDFKETDTIHDLEIDSLIQAFNIWVFTVGKLWRAKTTEDTKDTTLALKEYTPQEDRK